MSPIIVFKDLWRTIAAMSLVLGAMLAVALTMSSPDMVNDGPALAEGTGNAVQAKGPSTIIRVFVEAD